MFNPRTNIPERKELCNYLTQRTKNSDTALHDDVEFLRQVSRSDMPEDAKNRYLEELRKLAKIDVDENLQSWHLYAIFSCFKKEY